MHGGDFLPPGVVRATLRAMEARKIARFGRWTAITAAAVASAVLGTAGPASAASGTVNTSGSALTVRAAPGTGYDAWSSVADGYVYTGGDGYVEHKCIYSANPPRANPRGKDAAISWEFARLGSTADEGWCMRFQAQAYGWSYSGFSTAEVGGDWMVNHGYMHTSGIPPRGALVWYHNSAGTGHIVVSLGEGKIIGTSVGGKVGVAGYQYRTGYRGWSVPYFPLAG